MQRKVKYFTKSLLIAANEEAIKSERNRSIDPMYLKRIKRDWKYPVGFSMDHNGNEMRVQIIMNQFGESAWLDIPYDTYNSLPVQEV